MSTDIQRTILLVIFGFSLFMLWDRWQIYNGRAPMFGPAPVSQTPTTQQGPATPPTSVSRAPDGVPVPQAITPSAVPAVAATDKPDATAKSPPVVVETDVLRASIDPLGAVVSHVELLGQAVAPDWTASGLIGLVTGGRKEPKATTVLLDVGPNRVYVAQSGIVGGDFPNHRTPFKPIDGSTTLRDGQDQVDVRFSAESGGMRVIKTYTFHRGRYAADVRHEIVNLTDKPLAPSVYLQLTRDGNKPEGESALYYVYTGPAIFTEQEKFRKIE
ncbi:MAG TPA: membrane protein insertase YidC, partial [Burkholderiaceae bacterium]|nr:membrane protein insertase YidC [Burkholderiaceae bacterium]